MWTGARERVECDRQTDWQRVEQREREREGETDFSSPLGHASACFHGALSPSVVTSHSSSSVVVAEKDASDHVHASSASSQWARANPHSGACLVRVITNAPPAPEATRAAASNIPNRPGPPGGGGGVHARSPDPDHPVVVVAQRMLWKRRQHWCYQRLYYAYTYRSNGFCFASPRLIRVRRCGCCPHVRQPSHRPQHSPISACRPLGSQSDATIVTPLSRGPAVYMRANIGPSTARSGCTDFVTIDKHASEEKKNQTMKQLPLRSYASACYTRKGMHTPSNQ